MAAQPSYVDNREFMFLTVPWVRTVPRFDRYTPYTVYGLIEGLFRVKLVPAETVKLINGVIAYRVLKQYAFRFKCDKNGYFITLTGNKVMYFSDVDPCWTTYPLKGKKTWTPI
jgi:hypothetical protein